MKRGSKTKIRNSLRGVRVQYLRFTRKGHYAKAIQLRKYAQAHADLLRSVGA